MAPKNLTLRGRGVENDQKIRYHRGMFPKCNIIDVCLFDLTFGHFGCLAYPRLWGLRINP